MQDAHNGRQRSWWETIPWNPLLWLIVQTTLVVAIIVQMRADINTSSDGYRNNAARISALETLTQTINLNIQRLGFVEQSLTGVERRVAMLADRDAEHGKAIAELLTNQARNLARRDGQVSVIDNEIKRLHEQQMRIIQALDNTYNLLQEHLRQQMPPGTPPLQRRNLIIPGPDRAEKP